MTTLPPLCRSLGHFELQAGESRLRIEQLDESTFRVRMTRAREFSGPHSLMIVRPPMAEPTWVVEESVNGVTLRAEALELRIDRETLALSWFDAHGDPLVREPQTDGKQLVEFPIERSVFSNETNAKEERTADGVRSRIDAVDRVRVRDAYSTKTHFVFSPDEAIYGLGQHEEGILNYRGKSQFLYQQNMKVAMPAIVSTKGYGVLWDTSSLAAFHDDESGSYFWTEADDELDFYFVAGPEFSRIVAGFRALTGKPTMLPRWAYGYIQSKERYKSQDELLAVVAEHRRRRIPLDCIVLDWQSWSGEEWGQKTLDPERFPDPKALTAGLHSMGARLMVSVWPTMRNGCADQREMAEGGFLLGDRFTYDAFNPEARALYWSQANRGLFQNGIDAWWCDCTEPFESDWNGAVKPEPYKRVFINTEEAKKYLDPGRITAYSMLHSRGIFEGQRATTDDKRVVNLTRSGYPGQHRYGAITWAGDTAATWETLRRQIPDGLNFCVTGNPRWTFDIGAFFTDRREQWFWRGDFPAGVADLGYRELYLRWFQLGAFMPFFRSHGTDTPREVWRFGEPGEPVYEALLSALHLRYRLLPYIYSCAAAEHFDDATMVRMLAFDFRGDPETFDIKDQFLFGPSIMVCPVLNPMRYGPGSRPVSDPPTSRPVYLPRGTDWYDLWTGDRFEGGRWIDVEISLERIPLFVRAGAILPLGPVRQFVDEPVPGPTELYVFPGADGRFALYEDAGDGYAYERGDYGLRILMWSDAESTLRVEKAGIETPSFPTSDDFLIAPLGTGLDHESRPVGRLGLPASTSWESR